MDGFAVCSKDLARTPLTLSVIGESAAGAPFVAEVVSGTCVRIYTGAVIPAGADSVVMVESTRSDCEEQVEILVPAEPGANILRRGEDARRGETLISPSDALLPLGIAICATAGRSSVLVTRLPRVALIITGRELVAIPQVSDDTSELVSCAPALPHQIYDSNGPMLEAALTLEGFPVVDNSSAPDDAKVLESHLRSVLERSEVVVFTAGVSVGRYDLVPQAIQSAGAKILVHGVAMKPGKPFLFAESPEGKLIFGLPGNPLAAATTFQEFVLPALRLLAGVPLQSCRPIIEARLRCALKNKGGRHRFYPARLAMTDEGFEAEPTSNKSASDLPSGARADGVLIVAPDIQMLSAGARVPFRPWRRFP
jgi:molybdopterin molybdotransferase